MRLGLPNRLEVYFLITTFIVYAYLSGLNVVYQKDENYIYYAVLVFFLVMVINYIVSSLVHHIPRVPREISSIYFFGLAIALAGGTSLVLHILVTLLLIYWFWYLNSERRETDIRLKGLVLSLAIVTLGLGLSYPVLDIIHRPEKESIRSFYKSDDAPKYSIKTFTYGSGNDIRRKAFSSNASLVTKPFDASNLLDNWDGFSGWYRTRYWGVDSASLPLNARVWMPVGEESFPLVLISHGDHAMQDYSDNGYEYLAKPLAERGYIVALLDNNFLNRSWSDLMLTHSLTGSGEIQTRAQLLVEHLKSWFDWSLTEESLVFNKVDLSRVAVIGHSRGGEAVAHVPHLLEKSGYGGIDVKSVIAIAPVDGFYLPKGKPNTLTMTNYMVLHGSLDGEARFDGRGQYSRADVSEINGEIFSKIALYVEGANHGQFNSTWGRCDQEFFSPLCTRLNLKGLMPEALQQKFARTAITNFLDMTLQAKNANRSYIERRKIVSGPYLDARYKLQYQDSTSDILQDFQKPNVIDRVVLNNIAIAETKWLARGSNVHHLIWRDCEENPCWVKYDLAKSKKENFSKLIFDLANGSPNESNFTIKITHKDGTEWITSLEDYGSLGGSFSRSLKKSSYLLNKQSSEVVFDTYIISLENTSELKSLTFIFDTQDSGEVYVDNIGVL